MSLLSKLTQRLMNERGVAMVTVLFVGAALTAVASSAAFVTIHEFQSATDDRKAAESLAYSEAGIDRLVLELRRGRYTWADIREAGCGTTPPITLPKSQIGDGTFETQLVAFDPFSTGASRLPPAACDAVADDSPRTPHYFAITSVGQHPDARRVIRQVLLIRGIDLPVGIHAEVIDTNGNPRFVNISMLSATSVTQREKMAFSGTDVFYRVKDFWGEGVTDGESFAPAAVHALGSIYLKSEQQNKTEHTSAQTLDCTANDAGVDGQSQWDQSGGGGTITKPACASWISGGGSPTGPPPTSKIDTFQVVAPTPKLSDQDLLTLRDSAKRNGLYCFFTGVTTQCTSKGTATTLGAGKKVQATNLTNITDTNFVAYMEFDPATTLMATSTIEWDADVVGCNETVPGRSVTMIIRHGNVFTTAGRYVNGVILAPEGEVEMRGGSTLNGTVIAKSFDTIGSPTIKMNPCWLLNMPGPFLRVEPYTWSEIDR